MALRKAKEAKPVYKYQEWPSWRYNAETGEGRIFDHAEEVPDGWTNERKKDQPSTANRPAKPPQPAAPKEPESFTLPPIDEVNKTWIIEQLNEREIKHNGSWTEQRLYDLLADKIGKKD